MLSREGARLLLAFGVALPALSANAASVGVPVAFLTAAATRWAFKLGLRLGPARVQSLSLRVPLER